MAANKIVRFGPTTITAAAKNLINPGTATAGTGISPAPAAQYLILRHFRINNTTGSAITVNLFIGATGGSAAGTEFSPSSFSVAANSFVEWFGLVRLDNADFLTSTASGAGLTFDGEGEIGIA